MIKRLTGLLMLVGIGFYVAWDIYAALAGGTGATISEITIRELYGQPGLACIVGIVLGHLTWPVGRLRVGGWTELALALVVGAALLVMQRFLPPVTPVLPLLLGVALGHWVWPQSVESEKAA